MIEIISSIFLLVLILTSFSLGKILSGLLKHEPDSFLEEFSISTGLGLGLIANLVFVLGVLGLFRSWVMYLLLGILVIIALKDIKYLFEKFVFLLKELKVFREKRFLLLVLVILSLHLLLTFICSLAPVVEWDSLVQHLAVPKDYIQNHSIVPIDLRVGSDYPAMLEMLYILGMLTAGDITATLIHWSMSVLSLIMIFAISRKYFSASVGLLAAAIFFCCPLVTFSATGASIDMALVLFGLIAFYGFIDWIKTNKKSSFLISGLACGMASATKYTGLIVFSILFMAIIIKYFFQKKKTRIKIKNIFIYFGLCMVVVSPWLIKNLIYRGNPFYPFMHLIFGGEAPAESLYYAKTYSINLKSFLSFGQSLSIGRHLAWGDYVSVFYICFIPLFLFIKKRSWLIKYLLLFFAFGAGFFYIFSQNIRYLLPFFASLAIVAAYAVNEVRQENNFLRRSVQSFFIISLLFNLFLFAGLLYRRLPVVFGLQSKEEYLSSRIKIYKMVSYINKNLADDSRILLFDKRGYYLDREYVHGHNNIIQDVKTKAQALEVYRKLNLTHVLVNKGEWVENYWRKTHRDLVGDSIRLVKKENNVFLYEIIY